MARYRCILCDRLFELPGEQPALPAHVYPRGLFRGRRCASTYGVPVSVPRRPVGRRRATQERA